MEVRLSVVVFETMDVLSSRSNLDLKFNVYFKGPAGDKTVRPVIKTVDATLLIN